MHAWTGHPVEKRLETGFSGCWVVTKGLQLLLLSIQYCVKIVKILYFTSFIILWSELIKLAVASWSPEGYYIQARLQSSVHFPCANTGLNIGNFPTFYLIDSWWLSVNISYIQQTLFKQTLIFHFSGLDSVLVSIK